MRRLVVGLVVGLALAACSSPVPSGATTRPLATPAPAPSGGIPADHAVAIAREHVPPRLALVGVRAERFEPGAGATTETGAPNRWVWAVTFSGDVTVCSPSGSCLSPRPGTSTVYLDYFTGDFLTTVASSPP